MLKASFVSSAYFFCSVRAGSGKASLVAALAYFNALLNRQVAVIDADSNFKLKLKSAFMPFAKLYEYDDISALAKAQSASRFKKTVYFAETNKISYFPAHCLSSPSELFEDTALRDFFMQLCASFEAVFVNFKAGTKACEKISEIIGKNSIWHRNTPNLALVSLSDEQSLIALDELLNRAPSLVYQLQEKALLIFNKTPSSSSEQTLYNNSLNGSELKQMFEGLNTHIIKINEEFNAQKTSSFNFIASQKSQTNRIISSLNRALNRQELNSEPTLGAYNDFWPLLEGKTLQALSGNIERIKKCAAAKLLLPPSRVQVFLEENESSLRVRIRFSSEDQKHLGVLRPCDFAVKMHPKTLPTPKWPFISSFKLKKAFAVIEKRIKPRLHAKAIYRFNDNFAGQTIISAIKEPDFELNKEACPPPIFIEIKGRLNEIPYLSDLLMFGKSRFKPLKYKFTDVFLCSSEAVQFFVPPSFKLKTEQKCVYESKEFYNFFIETGFTPIIKPAAFNREAFTAAPSTKLKGDIFDIFKRNVSLSFINGFCPKLPKKIQSFFLAANRPCNAEISKKISFDTCEYMPKAACWPKTMPAYGSIFKHMPLAEGQSLLLEPFFAFKFLAFKALKQCEFVFKTAFMLKEGLRVFKKAYAFKPLIPARSKKAPLKFSFGGGFARRASTVNAQSFKSPNKFNFDLTFLSSFLEYKPAHIKAVQSRFYTVKADLAQIFFIKADLPALKFCAFELNKFNNISAFSPSEYKFLASFVEGQKETGFVFYKPPKSPFNQRFGLICASLRQIAYLGFNLEPHRLNDILRVCFKHVKNNYLPKGSLLPAVTLQSPNDCSYKKIIMGPGIRRLALLKGECANGLVKPLKHFKPQILFKLEAKLSFMPVLSLEAQISFIRGAFKIAAEIGALRFNTPKGFISEQKPVFINAKNDYSKAPLPHIPLRSGNALLRLLALKTGLTIKKSKLLLKTTTKPIAMKYTFITKEPLFKKTAPTVETANYRQRIKKYILLDVFYSSQRPYILKQKIITPKNFKALQKSSAPLAQATTANLTKASFELSKYAYTGGYRHAKAVYKERANLSFALVGTARPVFKQAFKSLAEELYKQLINRLLSMRLKKLPTGAVRRVKQGKTAAIAGVKNNLSSAKVSFLFRKENLPKKLYLKLSRTMFRVKKTDYRDLKALMQSTRQKLSLISGSLK